MDAMDGSRRWLDSRRPRGDAELECLLVALRLALAVRLVRVVVFGCGVLLPEIPNMLSIALCSLEVADGRSAIVPSEPFCSGLLLSRRALAEIPLPLVWLDDIMVSLLLCLRCCWTFFLAFCIAVSTAIDRDLRLLFGESGVVISFPLLLFLLCCCTFSLAFWMTFSTATDRDLRLLLFGEAVPPPFGDLLRFLRLRIRSVSGFFVLAWSYAILCFFVDRVADFGELGIIDPLSGSSILRWCRDGRRCCQIPMKEIRSLVLSPKTKLILFLNSLLFCTGFS